MEGRTITFREPGEAESSQETPAPGLCAIFVGGRPAFLPIRLGGTPVTLGRVTGRDAVGLEDDRVSRRHAQVALTGAGVRIADLGSRNGTFVDGQPARDEVLAAPPRVLRLGQSLLVFVPDVSPLLGGAVTTEGGSVVGPVLRVAHGRIARAAACGTPILLTGESGTGKEVAAQLFHAKCGRRGPLVAVNCAAVPAALAERLLFGARRGAYSGAVDHTEGYLQAADGGTLFLDEVGELEPSVQAKLLRVLETREVLPLGAARPSKVDIQLCAATLKDLRAEIAAGRFRQDLYYRIAQPEIRIPSLTERLEELPSLVHEALSRVDPRLSPTALFVEACLLRAWPGNVRELLFSVQEATRAALAGGRTVVQAKDLSEAAGRALAIVSSPLPSTSPVPSIAPSEKEGAAAPAEDGVRKAVEAALSAERGNVTRAARALGWHRNQLRRWLEREAVDPVSFSRAGDRAARAGR
ncbi:sigma-54 dependent transcriptional regulator [Sorangium cellulosum]|uniref:Sigma-54 dependent transcriptional regulator n=1 Tax=Sorangium cellulosum TaxID=56 RepID=A0A2L0ETC0_SORCE|nr:sigma 54-interacting transcriptional regulator [Sorangium cellulosum]AUX42522.1 sigma-54 dependent transcriptional regulator [Sorangium cellulosum]